MPTEVYTLHDHIFNWDLNKQFINAKKHGVTFKVAATVFLDLDAVVTTPHYVDGEERFNIIGFSEDSDMLTVCHCYRVDDMVIRIISARKATRVEEHVYRNGGE